MDQHETEDQTHGRAGGVRDAQTGFGRQVGMTTYLITYKCEHSTKMETFKHFAHQTEADDRAQEEPDMRTIGRWHNIADGSGVGIVEAKSEDVVYAFILNWAPFLEAKVSPLLDDASARKVVLSKLG